jgi:hypothetical protein
MSGGDVENATKKNEPKKMNRTLTACTMRQTQKKKNSVNGKSHEPHWWKMRWRDEMHQKDEMAWHVGKKCSRIRLVHVTTGFVIEAWNNNQPRSHANTTRKHRECNKEEPEETNSIHAHKCMWRKMIEVQWASKDHQKKQSHTTQQTRGKIDKYTVKTHQNPARTRVLNASKN